MLTSSFKTLLIGGKIAATATLLATTAIAQTTTIDTPQGNTVIVPDQSLDAQPSAGFVVETDYPRLDSMDNNELIAETLIAQGYTDVFISREGPILTVTAQRNAVPIELVYSTANGRLISVDGVETRAPAGGTSAGDTATGTTDAATTAESVSQSGDAVDDGATDESDTDAATDGTTTDADVEGTDAGADAGAEADTDGGDSDGAADADAGGSEGGDSDGADTDGADGDSDADGADSNG